MDRKTARTTIATALTALNIFDQVFQGTPDTFKVAGVTPDTVAVISSRSIDVVVDTHTLYDVASGVTVSIYVRRQANDSSATEDTLDDLAAAALTTLHGLSNVYVQQSDAGAAAAPNRLIDGAVYRLERIPIIIAIVE